MTVIPDDIAVEVGRPTYSAAEDARWSVWISDARLLILARLGNLDLLDQSVLDYVVRQAVAAQVRKPDDATQVDVAVDDGRVSRRYSSSAGRVVILDDWWSLLSSSGVGSGAFTITPYGAPDLPVQEWVV